MAATKVVLILAWLSTVQGKLNMFVTVTSVAAMLVMASSPAENFESAFALYSDCVEENLVSHIERNADENEYINSLSRVCHAEKQGFFEATVKYQVSEGDTNQEAKEYAEEEIQMVLDDSTSSYAERAGQPED